MIEDIKEIHYKLDISAHDLPVKTKRFSLFKSYPLLSFFEIVSLKSSEVSKD